MYQDFEEAIGKYNSKHGVKCEGKKMSPDKSNYVIDNLD